MSDSEITDESPIKFYTTSGKYGCFSNFSRHPVWMNDVKYRTSEHYFQAMKFTDHERQLDIERLDTPMKAANEGRKKHPSFRRDWDDVKDEIMYQVVKAKFTQHKDIKEVLLSTGNREIIEHTNKDSYWADGGDGTGKNMLGKTLMRVRKELRDELAKKDEEKEEGAVKA